MNITKNPELINQTKNLVPKALRMEVKGDAKVGFVNLESYFRKRFMGKKTRPLSEVKKGR